MRDRDGSSDDSDGDDQREDASLLGDSVTDSQGQGSGGAECGGGGNGGEDKEEDKVEEVNWHHSPFYIGKFFTKDSINECATCNTCSSVIKTKLGNTTGLDSHLARKHTKVYESYKLKKAEVESKRTELKGILDGRKRKLGQDVLKSKQTKLELVSGVLSMKAPPPNPRVQKEFVEAVTLFAIESGISFKALSGEGFQNVVNVLNKHSREKVKVLDRRNLARYVTKAHEEIVKEVTGIIKSCKDKMEGVAFTSDIWSSPTMESFISLTVHWVDQDWYLHRWTPFVKHFPDRHTGTRIKLKIDDMIGQLGLDDIDTNILKYVVNDNAANAVLAIKLSPGLIQILCAIHTLQLGIGDTFKEASVGPTEMKKVLQKGKYLSNMMKKSGVLTHELKEACKVVRIPYTTLKNPNDTRWNSSKTNLDSIIKIEKALNHLVSTDRTGQWTEMVFSSAEWRLAKAASKILEIPLKVTKVWEGEKYATINMVCSELYEMKKKLENLSSSSCIFSSNFAAVLNRKIENRFPNCEVFNDTPAIANYIDPHFKGVHIEALGALQATKDTIKRRFKYLDDIEPRDKDGDTDTVIAEEDENQDIDPTPTAVLLRARKQSGEQTEHRVMSKLDKEMEFFESNVGMEELKADGDRLQWWKDHERNLPLLSKVARQVLGIPCSSAKSERVFSTGGFMVSKRRARLGADRVESLIVVKENKKLVDEFNRKNPKKVHLNVDNDGYNDAFKLVVVEAMEDPPTMSAVFDDNGGNEEEVEEELYEDSSDDEFEVVINDMDSSSIM